MENTGITPVMNVGGYGYGDGCGMGNSWFFILALFALMNGGFGGWGANRFADGRVATVEDLNNSANFTRLENQVRANENTIQQGFTNLGNGICQLGYQLATDNGQIQKAMSECCCGINRNIDGVNYNVASQAAAINANTTAVGQKILDKLCENEKAAMAARINQLELQQALHGVVRYPMASTYNAGANPFCNNGCGCGCGY